MSIETELYNLKMKILRFKHISGQLREKLANDVFEIESSIKAKNNESLHLVSKRFWHFDCWDRTGKMQTITIEALNEENATIIFKVKHEDLGFDPPY